MDIAQKIRVLGIDPGLNITGYGVIDVEGNSISVVEAGVIRSTRSHDLGRRLQAIHRGIHDVVQSLQPDFASVEELYSHYERPKTAIIMGHARGGIFLALAQLDVPVVSYSATQIKKILTGNGRAPKHQVQLAVAHQLGLTEAPEPADVADALAIAICHYYLAVRPHTFS
ncbi:MAG: crossover junction endodeoxyribonuclease RuvC [Planctomycetota bacterium]